MVNKKCCTNMSKIEWDVSKAIRTANGLGYDNKWFKFLDNQSSTDKQIVDAYDSGWTHAEATDEFIKDLREGYAYTMCLKEAYINRENKDYTCSYCIEA